MRLALALGRTLAELGRSMDSAEFALWVAYDRIEGVPWPWLQTGIATASVVNCHVKKPMKPADFMPVKKRVKRQSAAEMLAAFRGFSEKVNAQFS